MIDIVLKLNESEYRKILRDMEGRASRALKSDVSREIGRSRRKISKKALYFIKKSKHVSRDVEKRSIEKRIKLEPKSDKVSDLEVATGFQKSVLILDYPMRISTLPGLKVRKKKVPVRRYGRTSQQYRYIVTAKKYGREKTFKGTWLMKGKHWTKVKQKGVIGIYWSGGRIKASTGASPALVLRKDKRIDELQEFARVDLRARVVRIAKGVVRRMRNF